MKSILRLVLEFGGCALIAWFWLAITIWVYEDKRYSPSERLTPEEKNDNWRMAEKVALCSALSVALLYTSCRHGW
jgi:hypothetical protein